MGRWEKLAAVFENIHEDVTKILESAEMHELRDQLRELFEERVQQTRQIDADYVGVPLESFYQ